MQAHPNGSAVTCHQPHIQGSKLKIDEVCFLEKAAFQSKQPQPWECPHQLQLQAGHTQATNSQTRPLSDLMPLASGSFTPPSWFLRGQKRSHRRSSSRAILTLSHKSCPAHKSCFKGIHLSIDFCVKALEFQGQTDNKKNSFYSAREDLRLATLAVKHLLLPSLNRFRGHQGLVTPSAHCKLALILHNSVLRW